MGSTLRFAAIIPVLAGLAWLVAMAMRHGVDEQVVTHATREMDSWAASRVRPADQTMASVQGELVRVVERNPAHPAAQELLGTLQLRRVAQPEYLEQAIVRLVKSLALRPTSGYTWGNVLDARYRVGDPPPAFEKVLLRAVELGPSEPEVQRVVADLGLATWKESSPTVQGAVERMVAAGMKRNPLEMLQIAGRRGRLDVACRHLVKSAQRIDPKWAQLCPSTEVTR